MMFQYLQFLAEILLRKSINTTAFQWLTTSKLCEYTVNYATYIIRQRYWD